MYLITNGQIVTEKEILKGYELLIEGDKIKKVALKGEINVHDAEVIDARGGYVAPGFIDVHSDYIEGMAAPRPNVMIDFNVSLRETEKILINEGITTMFHSLSLWKSDEFAFKPIRTAKNVKKFAEIIAKIHHNSHLIHHRFHARLEIDNIDEVENLMNYIKEDKVHLISFMDHTPGQGQYRDLEVYRRAIKGYRKLIDDEEVNKLIEHGQTKEKMTVDMIKKLANFAAEKDIAIASHDDDTIEKLEFVNSFGASISEFPITLQIAQNAKKLGMHTVAGAPNILLGGSHAGNLCAAEAIKEEAIDILCSDYYPASMLHAVFLLHEKYGLDLGKMFNLVTINPARAVKMDNIIGSIKENKKADIIIIEKIDGDFPVITSVFIDGNLRSRMDYKR